MKTISVASIFYFFVFLLATYLIYPKLYSLIQSSDSLSVHFQDGEYKKKYSITLNQQNIGYCTKKSENNREDYQCKLYLQKGAKSFTYVTKMTRHAKGYIEYNSPFVQFKKPLKKETIVYPFLFESGLEAKKSLKIYYPEKDLFLPPEALHIRFFKASFYAEPFTYTELKKHELAITPLQVERFKKVKSTKITEEYPVHFTLSFQSQTLPPNTDTQFCYKKDKRTICQLGHLPKKQRKAKKTKIKLKNLSPQTIEALQHWLPKAWVTLKPSSPSYFIPKLIDHLHQKITYQDISRPLSTRDILKGKKGDCTEFSQVSVDALRFLNIPARKAYGLLYKPEQGEWVYHSWVEYQDETSNESSSKNSKKKTIKSFDPVNKRAFTNIYYLKLGHENHYGITIIPLDIQFIHFKDVN